MPNKYGDRKQSALTHVLLAFIPYSSQSLKLAFRPNQFFNELEKNSGYQTATLKAAYKRGQSRSLISNSKNPKLTKLGMRKVQPFTAKALGPKARLMIIFDIPEEDRLLRQKLRMQLKALDFQQDQKSVWTTNMDYRDLLMDLIQDLGAAKYIKIYESHKLFPG